MCIAIVARTKFPSREFLECSLEQNQDGAGIAWIENGLVHWKKGLSTLEEIYEFEAKGPPWLVHFRISTVGGKIAPLCHPFPVTPDCSTALEGAAEKVLIHNGHWSEWWEVEMRSLQRGEMLPDEPWSDTKAMAHMGSIYGDGLFRLIASKPGNKIATMNNLGEIKTYGDWTEFKEEELLASNNPLSRSKTYFSKGATGNQYCLGKTYELTG